MWILTSRDQLYGTFKWYAMASECLHSICNNAFNFILSNVLTLVQLLYDKSINSMIFIRECNFRVEEVAIEADYWCCWLFLDHLRAISVLIADLPPIICDQLSDQEANSGRQTAQPGHGARCEMVSSPLSPPPSRCLWALSQQQQYFSSSRRARTMHFLYIIFVDCSSGRMANQQLLWC